MVWLDRLERLLAWLGIAVAAVLLPLLIGVRCYEIVMRKLMNAPSAFLQYIEWEAFALLVLLILGFAYLRDGHVRVDVLRERMAPRTRDWVDFYGLLLFQLPLVALVLWSAVPFVAESFATGEESSSAGGLPYRWILKSVLPIAFLALGAATLSRVRTVARRLFAAGDGA